MMRQIAGSFAEYEKAHLVAKLRGSRERKRAAAGKCEGRKSWAEINPSLVREARRLRRRSPKGHQRSLREIAAELARLGYRTTRFFQMPADVVGIGGGKKHHAFPDGAFSNARADVVGNRRAKHPA
jgi:hypothetical protein